LSYCHSSPDCLIFSRVWRFCFYEAGSPAVPVCVLTTYQRQCVVPLPAQVLPLLIHNMLHLVENNERLTPLDKVRANLKRLSDNIAKKPKKVACLVSTGMCHPTDFFFFFFFFFFFVSLVFATFFVQRTAHCLIEIFRCVI
jgi:hypothetical protein